MKKNLFVLLSILSFAVNAQTLIPVVWPFSNSSTQGAMVREIVQEANTLQKKYQFVFDHKPGSGGAVGVQHALAQKDTTVLAHTSSYFIRPHMNTEGQYDVDSFIMINNYCANQPLAFISKNISSLRELDKKQNITVGILPGSITQLVTTEYKKQQPRIDFLEAGFKGTPEITLGVLGGHIDLSVDWLASVNSDQLKVLAITGTQNIGSYRTFRSQGLSGFDQLTNSYYLFVNRNTPPIMIAELTEIFSIATQQPRVQSFCRQDFGTTVNVTSVATQKLFNEKKHYWKQQVKTVKK